MGESSETPLKLQFDRRVRLDFRGATVTSDAGLLACRELDAALGLTETANDYIHESRTGRNVQHPLLPLLRQSVYSRLAGYEGGYVNRCVNDIRRRPSQPLSQRRFHPLIERRDRRLRSTQGPSDA